MAEDMLGHCGWVWGCRPSVIVAACAVSGTRRLAHRAAGSVIRQALRWRWAADRVAMRGLVGAHLWQRNRRRARRTRFRVEDIASASQVIIR